MKNERTLLVESFNCPQFYFICSLTNFSYRWSETISALNPRKFDRKIPNYLYIKERTSRGEVNLQFGPWTVLSIPFPLIWLAQTKLKQTDVTERGLERYFFLLSPSWRAYCNRFKNFKRHHWLIFSVLLYYKSYFR